MVLRLNKTSAESFVKKVNFEKAGGLVPVVIQDSSNDTVLMQAFMNEEALRLTLMSGKIHFWSRSRCKIWLKGEESGHHSLLMNVLLDCDKDAILFKVHQIGAVCHTGQKSCFHRPIIPEAERPINKRIIERIFEVIMERIKNPTLDSYVSRLIAKGEDAILQKIGEEATEFILAAKVNHPKEIINEATDILFHLMILLAQKGLALTHIYEELEHRHQAKTRNSE